jgi:hypothetical protein
MEREFVVDQTFAQLARVEIEKLFDDAREAVGHERSAYIAWEAADDVRNYEVFATIYNGFLKKEGEKVPEIIVDMRQAALDAIITVGFMYPGKGQRLIWRQPPVIDHEPARKASKKYGWPAAPARDYLYMRVGAVPIHVNEFIEPARDY